MSGLPHGGQLRAAISQLVVAFSLLVAGPVAVGSAEASQEPDTPASDAATQVQAADEAGTGDGDAVVTDSGDPAPVAEDATPPPPEKESSWRFRWLGWDGIDFEIEEKTSFKNPSAFTDSAHSEEADYVASFFSVERLTFNARIGVRSDLDYYHFFDSVSGGGSSNQIDLRRFRVLTKGDFQLLVPLSYQLELGYVPSTFYIENMFLALEDVRWVGELKFGQFTAPMGLDQLTSNRWIQFMERAAPIEAMAPGVNLGLQMHRTFRDENMTFSGGFFTDAVTSDTGDASQNFGRLIGRLSWISGWEDGPAEDEPERLNHWGVSMNTVYSASESVQYHSRPESHGADYLIDTGEIEASFANTIGFEHARVNGNRLLQGEFFYSLVNADSKSENLGFWGGYLQASWILTGERRKYDKTNGVFGRVIPNTRADWKHKWAGALEVSGRLSYTDLSEGTIDGGKMTLAGVGLTWHARNRLRIKGNVIAGQVNRFNERSGVLLFQLRLSTDLGP